MMNIRERIRSLQTLITHTEIQYGRIPASVLLLAVSKQQTIPAIIEAYQQGITHFGENYFQEAQEKIIKLKDLAIQWHFIGAIQSNKTKGIATYFHWVHSISRIHIAYDLNRYRPYSMPPLNICLQVNLSNEMNKSGVNSDELFFLTSDLIKQSLPNVTLRGLMTILPVNCDIEQQNTLYAQLYTLKKKLNKQFNLNLDTLSMGMSDDLIPAIQNGATIVRIGKAIFGAR